MKIKRFAVRMLGVAGLLALAACTTTAQFRLPDQTKVRFGDREPTYTTGEVTTKPYFWTVAGGIPYKLEKDGKVVGEGKLQAKFRPVSIFWPPAALIYWPMGFGWGCYDLTKVQPVACQ